MVTSYITMDEAVLLYPNVNDFDAEQQEIALETSFSMVNSFLDGNLNIPVIMQDGEIPAVLKVSQARFFQWVLEHSNQRGWTEELQNLHDFTAEFLSKLGANELLISEVVTSPSEVGWNVVDTSLTLGKVFVLGLAPAVQTEYTFACTHSGTQYVADSTFDVTRSDSSSVLYSLTGSFDWQQVDSESYLYVRFDGQFLSGEGFTVKGMPNKNVVSTKDIIQQSSLLY